jgi:tRNA threonylcarbamoyl adenosine modification protein (Sua5/YciO/YrdC/YwlC family)
MSALVDLQGAIDALADGGVVAVPTDTVYGIAASLRHPSAVAELFVLKRRPMTVALPILVSSINQIEQLGVVWSPQARQLSDAFWPGPLTIIMNVPKELSELVGSTTGTVGFRSPNDELLLEVLKRSGPLALTSANEHREPPCESASQVLEVFAGPNELRGVVDGGPRTGQVSTVVDLSAATWRLVREGVIEESQLAALLS